jgi:DNA-binding NarL/FixJ family response regulator
MNHCGPIAMPVTVAVVDDNPMLRKSLSQLINSTDNLECIGLYSSVDEALQGVTANPPDVVMMDIDLPDIDGIEGTRRIKTANPMMDIVMLTVFADSEKIVESILAGASGYLLKKTPPDKILETIIEVRKGGSQMSSSVARTVLEVMRSWKSDNGRPVSQSLLTEREFEVLKGIIDGMSYSQIGDTLFISVDTVRTYIRHIYEKLQVHSKTAAIAEARKRGII